MLKAEDILKRITNLGPVEQIEKLLTMLENAQKNQLETIDLLHSRSEMVKIAITALQRVALDPTNARIGEIAQTALTRMKEIWEGPARAIKGIGDHGQNNQSHD